MTILQEKLYPIAGGAVAGAVFCGLQYRYNWTVPATMTSLFSSVINVCAIAIGFLGTAQSILVSMEDRPVLLQLRDSGTLKKIVGYVMDGIVWSFLLASVSALLMFVDWSPLKVTAAQVALPTTNPAPPARSWAVPLILSFWVFLLVAATLAYYRIISLFAKILEVGSAAVPAEQ